MEEKASDLAQENERLKQQVEALQREVDTLNQWLYPKEKALWPDDTAQKMALLVERQHLQLQALERTVHQHLNGKE